MSKLSELIARPITSKFLFVSTKGPFSVQDFGSAKLILIRQVQQAVSQQDIEQNHLRKNEEGIYHYSGRLKNADIPKESKHLIFLPRGERISELIILDIHLQNAHSGTVHTLAQLRQQFWIDKGRRGVNSAIRKCFGCRRRTSKPFHLPPMPLLPTERVQWLRPFEYIGLDYLGPISVRVIHNEKEKWWICIFTCFTT